MKRRLFTVLSALSLLLCVAVVGLFLRWMLGTDDHAYLHLSTATVRFEVDSARHRVVVGAFWPQSSDNERPVLALYPYSDDSTGPNENAMRYESNSLWGDLPGWVERRADFLGFTIGWGGKIPAPGWTPVPLRWVLALPLWLLPVTSAIPLIVLLVHNRRRVRRSKRLCFTCGYDLRATPEMCPECGGVPGESVTT